MSRFIPPAAKPEAPVPDPHAVLLARWMALTERLIFAAAYHGDPRSQDREWLRILDGTGQPYDRARASRRCAELCAAIDREGDGLAYQLLKAHRCNDDPTFRDRHAHLLPKRPNEPSRAERRTGVSDEQRMAEAEKLAKAWTA